MASEPQARSDEPHGDQTVPPAALSISAIEGTAVMVALRGPLVEGHCDTVERRLRRLARLGFRVVVIDLGLVEAIDSTGHQVIADLSARLEPEGGRVAVVDACGIVSEPLAGVVIRRAIPVDGWWCIPGP